MNTNDDSEVIVSYAPQEPSPLERQVKQKIIVGLIAYLVYLLLLGIVLGVAVGSIFIVTIISITGFVSTVGLIFIGIPFSLLIVRNKIQNRLIKITLEIIFVVVFPSLLVCLVLPYFWFFIMTSYLFISIIFLTIERWLNKQRNRD